MGFDVFKFTSQGGRDHNEDSVGSLISGNTGIFVVADGLGGHQKGELASKTAVDILTDTQNDIGTDLADYLNSGITLANNTILTMQREQHTVFKTTVAALAINEYRAVWANSGDSRVYFLHDRELCACTNDHSVAFKKYRAGEITRERIGNDEDQSALLRTLGNEERFEPELYSYDNPPVPGDAFLLCSDGAWEYLTDEEIFIDLLKSGSAEQWTELLLMRIIQRVNGKNDNLSIIAVKIV